MSEKAAPVSHELLLASIPRLRLGIYPTPVEEMPRLRAEIGADCPRLFIKRDDYTGFGFGGNKIRKLEYLFARLITDGVEAIVTTGGERSNHARMTAAICAKLGLRCVLVLDRKPRPIGCESLVPAPLLINKLFGAEVYITANIEERNRVADECTRRLSDDGLNVFKIPLGGATDLSIIGFVTAMKELSEQTYGLGLDFSHIFVSSSTAGTQTGMLIGSEIFFEDRPRIVGFSPEPESSVEIAAEIKRLLAECSEMIGFETSHICSRVEICDEYAGEGYCMDTAAAEAALKMVARTEGIVLDPVYTAKAMAGMLDWIAKGKLDRKDNILFWHTGGQLANFYSLNNDTWS